MASFVKKRVETPQVVGDVAALDEYIEDVFSANRRAESLAYTTKHMRLCDLLFPSIVQGLCSNQAVLRENIPSIALKLLTPLVKEYEDYLNGAINEQC